MYIEFATPEKNLTTVDCLFTTKAGVGWVGHSAYITGWPILVILIVIVICSLPFVRRGGHFQVRKHPLFFFFYERNKIVILRSMNLNEMKVYMSII